MNRRRQETEKERREKARRLAGKVVAGSGKKITPKSLDQIVTLRLDSNLIVELRKLAKRDHMTVSELLREGAALLIQQEQSEKQLPIYLKFLETRIQNPAIEPTVSTETATRGFSGGQIKTAS